MDQQKTAESGEKLHKFCCPHLSQDAPRAFLLSLCPLILLSLARHGQTTTTPQPYDHTSLFLLFIWGATCFACGRQVLPTDLTWQESLCTPHGPYPTSIPAPGPVTTHFPPSSPVSGRDPFSCLVLSAPEPLSCTKGRKLGDGHGSSPGGEFVLQVSASLTS